MCLAKFAAASAVHSVLNLLMAGHGCEPSATKLQNGTDCRFGILQTQYPFVIPAGCLSILAV